MPSRFTMLWQLAKDMLLKVNSKDVHRSGSETGKEEAQNPIEVAESSVANKSSTTCMFTWASRPADKPTVRGFETQILSLKKLLGERENDTQFKAVGVVGVRGVGKTALCQVCFYQDDDDSFSPKVWVKVAKSTKAELLRGVLERLRVESETISYRDENEKITGLTYLLRCQLIGKRYLVVLDGVSNPNPWYGRLFEGAPIRSESGSALRLACGFPKGSAGTVIVTSRDEKGVERMVKEGRRDTHCLVPLSDPESLAMIFQDAICKLSSERHGGEVDMKKVVERVEKTTITKRQLLGEEIKTEQTIMDMVVRKSNGLPLAAKLMAETMLEQLDQREKELAQKVAAKKNEKASHGEVDNNVSEEDKKDEAGKISEVGQAHEREGGENGEVEDSERRKGVGQGQHGHDEKTSTLKKRDGLKGKETSNDQIVQRKEEEEEQKQKCGDGDSGSDDDEIEEEHDESTTQRKEKEEKKHEDEKEEDEDEEDTKEVAEKLNQWKEKREEKHKDVGEKSTQGKEIGEPGNIEATKKIGEKPTQGKDGEQEQKEAAKEVCKKSIQDKETEETEEHDIATNEVGEESTTHGKEEEEATKEVCKKSIQDKEKEETEEHDIATNEVGEESITHGKEEEEATKEVVKESTRGKEKEEHEEASG